MVSDCRYKTTLRNTRSSEQSCDIVSSIHTAATAAAANLSREAPAAAAAFPATAAEACKPPISLHVVVCLTVRTSEEHRHASSGSRSKFTGNAASSSSSKSGTSSKDNGHVAETRSLSVDDNAAHGKRHTNDQIALFFVVSICGETNGLTLIAYECSLLSKCMVVH